MFRCSICANSIQDSPVHCERCRTPFHKDCWDYQGGCAVFGCSPRPASGEVKAGKIGAWLGNLIPGRKAVALGLVSSGLLLGLMLVPRTSPPPVRGDPSRVPAPRNRPPGLVLHGVPQAVPDPSLDPALARLMEILRPDLPDLLAAWVEITRLDRPDLDPQRLEAEAKAVIEGFRAISRDVEGEPGMLFERLNAYLLQPPGAASARAEFRTAPAVFFDPACTHLDQVLEKREGLPLSVGLLYLLCARAAGVHLRGVDTPGLFLLRYEGAKGPMFIDVSQQGKFLTLTEARERIRHFGREALLEEFGWTGDRAMVYRLGRNLALAYRYRRDGTAAARWDEIVRVLQGAR